MPIFSRLPGHEGVTVPIIEARNLRKDFRVFKRREGVWGAVRDLFHRDYVTLAAVDGINLNVDEGDTRAYVRRDRRRRARSLPRPDALHQTDRSGLRSEDAVVVGHRGDREL